MTATLIDPTRPPMDVVFEIESGTRDATALRNNGDWFTSGGWYRRANAYERAMVEEIMRLRSSAHAEAGDNQQGCRCGVADCACAGVPELTDICARLDAWCKRLESQNAASKREIDSLCRRILRFEEQRYYENADS